MDKTLNLIYINHVGANWRDLNIYEFIFSNTTEEIDGDDWDVYPASNGEVTPPPKNVIKMVGVLETELDLNVVRDSDKYSVWDALDGIIPLAYEQIQDYTEYPDNRLVFPFGITVNEVNEILYPRDIILEYKEIKNEA